MAGAHHPSGAGGGGERTFPSIAQTGMTLDEAESRPGSGAAAALPQRSCAAAFRAVRGVLFSHDGSAATCAVRCACCRGGLVASWYLLWCGRHEVPGGFPEDQHRRADHGWCASWQCNLLAHHLASTRPSSVRLMILYPGHRPFYQWVSGHLWQGDYLSGHHPHDRCLAHCRSIAIGTGLVRGCTRYLRGWSCMMSLTAAQIGERTAQFFLAAAGTLSFAILFACPRRCLPYCALVGAVGWLWYEMLTLLGARRRPRPPCWRSCPLTILTRVFAITQKTPVTVFLLTGIFPLVPGAGIYTHRLLFHPERKHPCPCQWHQHL